MFSTRSCFEALPNVLAQAMKRVTSRGGTVLDLTASNPTQAGIAYPGQLLAPLSAASADYVPEPFGLGVARSAVVEHLALPGLALSPEQIVLTAGTSEAYSILFKLLCDPGDELLAPVPSYPLLDQLAQLEGVRLVRYPLVYDGAWHLDLSELERRIGARTRGIVFVHPNNPTGSYLKLEELAALARLGLPLISDEVFESYALKADETRARSALQAGAALVFALGGLSKEIGLPGVKLSWIAVGGKEPALAEALARLELICDGYLSVSTPVQVALPRLLIEGRAVTYCIKARLAENLAWLRSAVDESPASLLFIEGGWYACLRLPDVASEEAWVVGLLEEDGVLVHPGWFYDFIETPVVVLSLLTEPGVFQNGLERLLERVRSRSS